MELETGMSYTMKVMVDESNTASIHSEDLPKVYSTPAMKGAKKIASYECVLSKLPKGRITVGTHTRAIIPKALLYR